MSCSNPVLARAACRARFFSGSSCLLPVLASDTCRAGTAVIPPISDLARAICQRHTAGRRVRVLGACGTIAMRRLCACSRLKKPSITRQAIRLRYHRLDHEGREMRAHAGDLCRADAMRRTAVRAIRTACLVPVKAAHTSCVQIALGSSAKLASRHGYCDVDRLGHLGYIQHIAIFCRKRQRNSRGDRVYSVHVGRVLKVAKKDLDRAVPS